MMKFDPDRVYLDVPFNKNEEAKRCRAQWCPVQKLWWVTKADVASYPATYKWMMSDDSRLAAQAKEAYAFSKAHRSKGIGRRSKTSFSPFVRPATPRTRRGTTSASKKATPGRPNNGVPDAASPTGTHQV